MSVLASILLIVGLFFVVSAGIGVVRFPDFYTRLHAAGKCDTVGVALMVLGLVLLEGATLSGAKILILLVFIFLAGATAAHALGRAAHRSGLAPWAGDVAGDEERN